MVGLRNQDKRSNLNGIDLEVNLFNRNHLFCGYCRPSVGNRTTVELNRKDYDKIMNQKAFRLKFKLKKHEIL